MTLFIDANEYLGNMAESVGAIVSLQSPFTQFNQIDGDPILIAPGSAVSVSINAVGPFYPFNLAKKKIHLVTRNPLY